jgi:hypothetical protein
MHRGRHRPGTKTGEAKFESSGHCRSGTRSVRSRKWAKSSNTFIGGDAQRAYPSLGGARNPNAERHFRHELTRPRRLAIAAGHRTLRPSDASLARQSGSADPVPFPEPATGQYLHAAFHNRNDTGGRRAGSDRTARVAQGDLSRRVPSAHRVLFALCRRESGVHGRSGAARSGGRRTARILIPQLQCRPKELKAPDPRERPRGCEDEM